MPRDRPARPCFFRPTAGLRNHFLEPILARRGFDTRNRDADGILLLHDGDAARTSAGQPVILAVLPRVLEAAAAAGLKSTSPCVPRSAWNIRQCSLAH